MAYHEGIQTAAMAEKAYHDKYASAEGLTEETAFSALSQALDRSNLLAQRVQQLADRLVGSVPTPVSDAAIAKAPAAVFPTVRHASYETLSQVGDALDALDRIERALP